MASGSSVIKVCCASGELGDGDRLDRFLASRIETLSRARLQGLIRAGHVSNGPAPVTDPGAKVRGGDWFEVRLPEVKPYNSLAAESISLDILFEDDSLIVIDKPAGLVVHPGAGNSSGTLVNALLAHCGDSLSGIGGIARPGIVHRLDKDTSGVMVVAKSDEAHRGLAAQFADHGRTGDLRREYLAVVWGLPKPPQGRIQTQIGRHPTSRLKMTVLKHGGREAITNYETIKTYAVGHESGLKKTRGNNPQTISVVRCNLETGRTHQVRVHMAHAGAPIVGDALYATGFQSKVRMLAENAAAAVLSLNGQALHAATLRFRHPVTRKILTFESKLPIQLSHLCKTLESFEPNLSKN